MTVKKATAKRRVGSRPTPASAKAKTTAGGHLPVAADKVDGALFTTEQAGTITVPRGRVQLFVKGSDHGQVNTNGQSIGELGVASARSAGIRTFSLYADGVKVEPGDTLAKAKADSVAKLEVVPKDSRG
jgi:hypothetical protein